MFAAGSPSPSSARKNARGAVLALAALVISAVADDAPDFAREIFPVLEKRCFECHGEKKVKAGLRLDAKELALAGGDSGAVIVPGKSAASAMISRVNSEDKDERMPPKGGALTSAQIAMLRA